MSLSSKKDKVNIFEIIFNKFESGKVNIGAFRTYPNGYKPPDDQPNEYQSIPLAKIEDFGVHCKQYYQLDVSYFKSETDKLVLTSLWNKYWSSTISTSSLKM